MTTKKLFTNLDSLNVTNPIQGYLTQLVNPNLTEAEYSQIRYQYLKLNEGYFYEPYIDTAGKITVGIGFNMDAAGAKEAWQQVFQGSVNFDAVYNNLPGATLTDPQIRQLYDYSVSVRETALFGSGGIYANIKDNLTANQKLAIEDLYFNGGSGLVGIGTSFYSNMQNYIATGNQAYLNNALEEVMDRSNSSFDIGLSHRRLKEGAMLSGNVDITQSEEELAQLVAHNIKAGFEVKIDGKSWTDYLGSRETDEFKNTLQLDQNFLNALKSELQNQIQQSIAINPNIQSYLDSFHVAEGQASMRVDPLTLDLDGDGVELVNVNNSTVFFDLDVVANGDGSYTSDGVKEQVGWVAGDDGILALDKNNNGVIDNILELFGKSNKTGTQELREYDLNNDLKINASDAVFSQLKVWQDVNQDGVSQSSELKTLSQLGISSINVSDSSLTQLNQVRNGNVVLSQGSYVKSDGTTGVYANLDLGVNQTNSVSYTYKDGAGNTVGDYDLKLEALSLPMIRGYGDVKALPIAASENSELLNLLQQLDNKTLSDLNYLAS